MSASASEKVESAPAVGRDEAAREGGLRADIVALMLLGLVVGLTCRGHFAKPHNDFYQFRETGHALLHGELPDTFKRAPVFPLLVASLGSLIEAALPFEVRKHPDVLAAEWLNALELSLLGGEG